MLLLRGMGLGKIDVSVCATVPDVVCFELPMGRSRGVGDTRSAQHEMVEKRSSTYLSLYPSNLPLLFLTLLTYFSVHIEQPLDTYS